MFVYIWIVIIHFDYCLGLSQWKNVCNVIHADLLHRVVQHESSNKMSQTNLTSLFGPTLMSVDGDPVSIVHVHYMYNVHVHVQIDTVCMYTVVFLVCQIHIVMYSVNYLWFCMVTVHVRVNSIIHCTCTLCVCVNISSAFAMLQ